MYSRWGYHRVWPWSHQLAVSQRVSLGLGNRWGVKVGALLHQLTDSQRWSLGLHRWGYPRVFPLIHLWVAPQRVVAKKTLSNFTKRYGCLELLIC